MTEERAQLQPLDVVNLRNHIEQQISNAILNGVFRPGERLVESTITQTLSVSRAPVREALAAQEREGIVVQTPR
jgi:DNA-binding GntR family transcriptional regulator